ncbi:MAG: hypothetical protein R3A46_08400 [Thermomicrobiales bacterium]
MKQFNGLERLADLLSRNPESSERPAPPPDASSYEATTRQMVLSVEEDVRSLRRRLDALIFMVLSAILVEAATRLFGG